MNKNRIIEIFEKYIWLLAVFIFISTYLLGIKNGMDQKIPPEAYGRILSGYAGAFTKDKLQQDGFVLSNLIYFDLENQFTSPSTNILENLGLTKDKVGSSAIYIDILLNKIANENKKYQNLTDIRGFGADDFGIITYVEIANYIFGIHIRALYYLFFLIYGISMLIAFLSLKKDLIGQLVVIIVAAVIYSFTFNSGVVLGVSTSTLETVYNPRYLGILCIIPIINIILLISKIYQFSFKNFFYVFVLSAIIFFSIHLRSSAFGVPLGLILILLFSAISIFRVIQRKESIKNWGSLYLKINWPALVVLFTIALGYLCVNISLNNVYKKEGWLTHHAFWHSVYYSLQQNPKWNEKYLQAYNNKVGDEMPWEGIYQYLKNNPHVDASIYYYPSTNQINYTGMEVLGKKAFFDFTIKNPVFVVKTFLIYKPISYIKSFIEVTKNQLFALTKLQLLIIISLISLISLIAFLSSIYLDRIKKILVYILILSIPFLAIPFATVVAISVNVESLVLLQILLILFSAYIFSRISIFKNIIYRKIKTI